MSAASIALGPPAFAEKPCLGLRASDRVRCGTVTVPEDRAKPGGRTIGLNVMVLRAKDRPTLPPLFDIAGGPGLPAVGPGSFYLGDGAAYREHRDIVLFDQRGTGASNPLNCPEIDATESGYGPFFPPETVARCRQRLRDPQRRARRRQPVGPRHLLRPGGAALFRRAGSRETRHALLQRNACAAVRPRHGEVRTLVG